jgi:hypothetical protein
MLSGMPECQKAIAHRQKIHQPNHRFLRQLLLQSQKQNCFRLCILHRQRQL